jgi:hypothetical protein
MSSAFKYQSQYYVYRDSMHNLEQIEEIKNLQLKAATAETRKSSHKQMHNLNRVISG